MRVQPWDGRISNWCIDLWTTLYAPRGAVGQLPTRTDTRAVYGSFLINCGGSKPGCCMKTKQEKEQWSKDYAKWKWEVLRRNPKYREDFDELDRQGFSRGDFMRPSLDEEKEKKKDAFRAKWKLSSLIDHRCSFEELDNYDQREVFGWAEGGDPFVEMDTPADIWDDETLGKERLAIFVDLRFDKKVILSKIESILEELIERAETHAPPKEPPTRQRHSFKRYPRYFQVYDLREEEALSFPEIAERIFPDDFKDADSRREGDPQQQPEAKIDLVKHYYREAKRMITYGI